MSFIFGGNTEMSYDDIQRKRALANSLAGSIGSPRNVGEGLSAIGKALAVRGIEKRTSRREGELKAEADDKWKGVFSALTGGQSSGGQQAYTIPPVTTRTEGQQIGADTMEALVRTGLTQRGLPEHVADAFVMNFRDESGLNPDINEKNPIVPGSRGGFGLAQWTGPRRKALEAFAAQRGAPVSDLNTQLDFLMTELQGPESAAAQSILAAPDAGTAATEIVTRFLRPAEEHRNRRVAQYSGSSGLQNVEGQMPRLQAIAEALGDPYISRDPGKAMVLQALMGQALKPQEQGYQVVSGADLGLGGDMAGSYFNLGPDGKVSQIGGGGTNVSVNNEAPVPKDHRAVRDENNNLVGYEVVPGSPTDREIEEQEAKAKAEKEQADKVARSAAETEVTQQSVVQNATKGIRDMLEGGGMFDLPEVGIIGNAISGVNQEARNMKGRIDTLKGMVAFDRLNEMKKASAVGASGLGALSERELDLLSAQLGALDQSLGKDVILETLDTIDDVFGKLSPEAQAYLTGKTDVTPQEAFQKFSADPENRAAAEKYGVSLEDMWNAR